ncbi:hypothetical protein JYU16_02015 [bacterium AH-315-M05]|nr:hypothetical protein [bacterium AH-315-M05]
MTKLIKHNTSMGNALPIFLITGALLFIQEVAVAQSNQAQVEPVAIQKENTPQTLELKSPDRTKYAILKPIKVDTKQRVYALDEEGNKIKSAIVKIEREKAKRLYTTEEKEKDGYNTTKTAEVEGEEKEAEKEKQ